MQTAFHNPQYTFISTLLLLQVQEPAKTATKSKNVPQPIAELIVAPCPAMLHNTI
jgi:hypothetical protein